MKVRLEITLDDSEVLRMAEHLDPYQREASGDVSLSKRCRVSILRAEFLTVISAHLDDLRQEMLMKEEQKMIEPHEYFES